MGIERLGDTVVRAIGVSIWFELEQRMLIVMQAPLRFLQIPPQSSRNFSTTHSMPTRLR